MSVLRLKLCKNIYDCGGMQDSGDRIQNKYKSLMAIILLNIKILILTTGFCIPLKQGGLCFSYQISL